MSEREVMRVLADQTTADNPGLLPVTPIAQPIVAAKAPVLSELAAPLRTGIGRPIVGSLITGEALIDPPEKHPVWPTADGSETVPATTHMATFGLNVSRQLQDWAELGSGYDTSINGIVLQGLEATLLEDLAAGGTAAADLAAAFAACSPQATHVFGSLAGLFAVAGTLLPLSQLGVAVTAIATPNLAAGQFLVVCRPAVELAATGVRMVQNVEPARIGVAVAGYAYGLAAPLTPTAVQVITAV